MYIELVKYEAKHKTLAFIISGTPFMAQCAYSKTATPIRRSFTGVYGSATDNCV